MAKQTRKASDAALIAHLGPGLELAERLVGGSLSALPADRNPVWQALIGMFPPEPDELQAMVEKQELTEQEAADLQAAADEGRLLADALRPYLWRGGTPNKRAILQAYHVCQVAALNSYGGPIGDGSLGTIRQQWYFSKVPAAMGFKFAAQTLEKALVSTADIVIVGDEREWARALKMGADSRRLRFKTDWNPAAAKAMREALGRSPRVCTWPKSGWGRAYAQEQSEIMADLVRDGLTYTEMWVEDATRLRMSSRTEPMFGNFFGVLLLEKEGLVDFFQGFCQRAGIRLLVGMGGNNSFSAVEQLLDTSFRDPWQRANGGYLPSAENPLHVFVLSDHDYYGHVPVQNGAIAQFRRFLPDAVELHRIGIVPDQLRRLGRSVVQAGYEFEWDENEATREWAAAEGIWVGDACYGIEVEALAPRDFVPDLVVALVEALGGEDELRDRLVGMIEPDWHEIESHAQDRTYASSVLRVVLERLEDWATESRWDAERPLDRWVSEQIGREGDPGAWRNREGVQRQVAEKLEEQGEAISRDALVGYVQAAGSNGLNRLWRPVSAETLTEVLCEQWDEDFDSAAQETAENLDQREVLFLAALERAYRELGEWGLEWPSDQSGSDGDDLDGGEE